MKKITSTAELRETILLLEAKQADEARLLKEQFKVTYEKLKPINLIKSKISELVSSPDLKENILNTSLGLVAGYLSKKATVGATHNPLKKLLGTIVQIGVSSLVSKNSEGIKSAISSVLHSFLSKKKQHA